MRYFLNMRLETFQKDWLPNIQIDVGQINQLAINFYDPTPSKIAKMWGIIFSHNNNAIYGLNIKLHAFVIFENAQHWSKSSSCIFLSKSGSLRVHSKYLLL